MKILSVDDSATIRRLIKNALDVIGYELLEANNGKEALEVLEKYHSETALILLDWNMPVMDGLEALKKMKADPRFSPIPVTMVTTETERAKIIAAIEAGAKNYIMKPFSQEELIGKIMECLGIGI
jgi:two-component system, chemotaxis family, chemotaxis protein CheY